MRKSFILHIDSLSVLDKLTVEQAGLFIIAIRNYKLTGELPSEFWLQMALEPFINQFKRDDDKYEEKSERNRINGSKGGRPKNPQEPNETQKTQWVISEPKKADNDNDNDSVSDNGSDSVSDKVISPPSKYSFEDFWNRYNKKTDRKATEAYWKKMPEEKKILAVEQMNNHKAGKEPQYWKAPIRYLRDERWTDQPTDLSRIVDEQPKRTVRLF